MLKQRVVFCGSAGFKALLRYEGFDNDTSKDFWCNLCIPEVHPVGWCASSSKPLVPPKSERCSSLVQSLILKLLSLLLVDANCCCDIRHLSPLGIQHKYSNWKPVLVKRLTGAKTLPTDFTAKVKHAASHGCSPALPNASLNHPLTPCRKFLVIFPTSGP